MTISVYITSYNQKGYLIEAIESVLAQSLPPDEIVIVDDGSSDGSQDIIADYAARYLDLIKPVYHTVNQGVSAARIDALEAVTGNYITSLDGDDLFYPRKLELELAALQNQPRAQWVYSGVDVITSDGEKIKQTLMPQDAVIGNIFEEIVLRKVSPRSMLLTRQALDKAGTFDRNLVTHEDWDFKIRLSKHAEAAYVPEVLSAYRIHRAGLHSATASRVRVEQMKRVIQQNRDLLNDLPQEQARRLEQGLALLLFHRQIKLSIRTGKRSEGWQLMRDTIKLAPRQVTYWKFAILLLLPTSLSTKLLAK